MSVKLLMVSEGSCLKLNLKVNNKPITIVAIYRSPQNNIKVFLFELNTAMTSGTTHKNCVLMDWRYKY